MQSRLMSLTEAAVNVAVGFLVAVAGQAVIFPVFGIHVSPGDHLAIGLMFTFVSLARSYALRRFFNWWGARA